MYEPLSTGGPAAQVDQTDLRSLVDCSYSIGRNATLEEAHRAFQKHGHEFMAVVDGRHFVGLCSRSGIGMILGSRFGFSIFSKKPVGEHMLPSPVVICIGTALRGVLDKVFSRASDEFYDDIALIDDDHCFEGLIQVHSLVKLQHRMLFEKLKQVEMQERNLRDANQQLAKMAAEISLKNEELARARDEAVEGTRMKSEFLANMSHEIRTPMNGVIGMVNLLMETPLTPEQLMFAKTVRSSAESLLDIINDILDFSKIEAGRMEVSLHEFDFRDVIEGSLHLLVERAAAKGLELVWDIGHEVPMKVMGDSTRIRQIVLNLVGNAVKFTASGEVVIRAGYNEEKGTMRFEVRDTGPGISENVRAKLFSPFTQADGSTTRKYGGTGLGLSISRRLTDLMGGRIGCMSELGRGSLFWFEVPMPRAASCPPMKQYDFEGRRVLILDDNATSREVFCKHLELSNLRCSAVPSAVEARALVHSARRQGDPFSFLLLDLVTSPEDVEAFCTELRDENAMEGLSIVGLTVVGNPSSAILSDPNLVARHLYKPVRFIDLCACLEGLLRVPASRKGDVVVRGREESAGARPLQVLVVEDTVTNQVVARMMVEKLGHKCHVVANGLEALEVVRRQHFDCILMDCMMPEMDGFETTRRIRAGFCGDGPQDVHIIAMTANAMRGDRERCIESGMDEYISKPVRRAELASKLENVQRLIYAACAD